MTASAALGHNHDCKRSRDCKKEFGLLGCIKLYKLKTAQERCSYIKETGHCMRCGEIFRTGRSGGASRGGWSGQKSHHKCVWNREKIQMVRCTETYGQGPCYFGAATCLTHEEVSNNPKELLDWLKKQNIPLTIFTVQCGQVSSPKKC